jgi:hypothetical protein
MQLAALISLGPYILFPDTSLALIQLCGKPSDEKWIHPCGLVGPRTNLPNRDRGSTPLGKKSQQLISNWFQLRLFLGNLQLNRFLAPELYPLFL